MNAAERAPLVPAEEVARVLGVSVDTVRTLARRKAIPVVRIGRLHRFDVEAVVAALQTGPAPAPPKPPKDRPPVGVSLGPADWSNRGGDRAGA